MAEYQARSTDALSFDVTKEEQLIGKLNYKAWFKFKAVIEIPDQATYRVKPKGFGEPQ